MLSPRDKLELRNKGESTGIGLLYAVQPVDEAALVELANEA